MVYCRWSSTLRVSFQFSLFGCLFAGLSLSFVFFFSFFSILRLWVLFDRLPHIRWYWHHYWIIIMLICHGISLSFNAFAIVLYVDVKFSRNVNYYDPNCAVCAETWRVHIGVLFWLYMIPIRSRMMLVRNIMPIGTWTTKIQKRKKIYLLLLL